MSTPPAAFIVGEKVYFRETKRPWTVQAISKTGRWIALTRKRFGQIEYTVMDLDLGVRGADNYGSLGYETRDQCERAIAQFDDGDAEVSLRNWVFIHPDQRDPRYEALTGLALAAPARRNEFYKERRS